MTMLERQVLRLSSAIVLSGLLTCAQAVELGDALVRSHLGQPLSADIELTSLANDAATVQAGLASADVYRGASIGMHPALSALSITIVRRDGRRYLHLASPTVVNAEFINIFFKMTENGQHSVRQATLWFTPDPNPAPPPVAVVTPRAAMAVPAPTLPVAAPRVAVAVPAPALPVAAPRVAVALPPAALPAKAFGAPRPIPVLELPPQQPLPQPLPLPRPQPQPRTESVARPAVHAPQFTAAQIATCGAIDAKNAALSGQIVELEDKVRRLTLAMQGGAVAVAAVPPAAAVARAAPARPMLLKPMGAPPEQPARKTPWLFFGVAGAVMLALAGALSYFLRRKRTGSQGKRAPRVGPGLIAGVKNRLMPAKKAAPEAPAEAEPVAG